MHVNFVVHINAHFFATCTGTQLVAKEDRATLPHPTIRHGGCDMILPADASVARCKNCTEYRKSLRSQCSRYRKRTESCSSRTDPSSHINLRYLQAPEKDERIRKLHDATRALSRKVSRLQAKIKAAADKSAVVLDMKMHDDIQTIMSAENLNIMAHHETHSFQYQFWEQQRKAAGCSDARGM